MSEEPLQPQSLGDRPPGDTPSRSGGSNRSLWILAAVVLIAGFALIGWLSRRTEPVAPPAATPTPQPTATPTPDPAARREADRALERLLALLGPLRETRPEVWAGEAWEELMQTSDLGDAALADQRWDEAEAAYEEAIELAERLKAAVSAVPQRLYPQAVEAYSQGERERAVELLETLLLIDAEHQPALDLLPRAERADQSFARLQRARGYLEENRIEPAFAEISNLMGEDRQFPGADSLQEQIEDRITEKELESLLGNAWAAMEAGDVDKAEAAVGEAVALAPDHPGVRDAREELDARILERKTLALRKKAERLQEREQWKAAHNTWLEIEALDPDAPWVKSGLAKSLRWAVVDEKIRKGLEDPASRQTAQWVEDFKDRSGWPASLAIRAEKLAEQHEAWNTPVPVLLRSDGNTQVTLPGKGRWTEVIRKEIELLPGSYVAKGGRLGYRDVRVEFKVPPGAEQVEVEVICTEGI